MATSSKHKCVGLFSSLPGFLQLQFYPFKSALPLTSWSFYLIFPIPEHGQGKPEKNWWDVVWITTTGISSFPEGKGVLSDLSLGCLFWNFKRIWSIYHLSEMFVLFFFLHYRSQNKGIRTVRSSHDALKGARKIKNYSYLIYKNGDNNCTILIGGCEDYILGTIYVASTV